MTELGDIPLTFVVLDIIKPIEGANWYGIEQGVPLHQDFVDQAYSVREVLTRLLEDGFIRPVGEGSTPTLK